MEDRYCEPLVCGRSAGWHRRDFGDGLEAGPVKAARGGGIVALRAGLTIDLGSAGLLHLTKAPLHFMRTHVSRGITMASSTLQNRSRLALPVSVVQSHPTGKWFVSATILLLLIFSLELLLSARTKPRTFDEPAAVYSSHSHWLRSDF